MIEMAFVSGEQGRAVYYDEGQLYELKRDDEPIPVSGVEFHRLLGPSNHYSIFRRTSLEALREELELSTRQSNCVFLFLTLLDAELSISTRIVSAEAVEDLLDSERVREFVENRLLSKPLPNEVRIRRREIMSPISGFERARLLAQRLFDSQAVLDELWFQWSDITKEQGIEADAKAEIETRLIESGVILELTRNLESKNLPGLNMALIGLAVDQRIASALTNPQALILAFRSRLQDKFFGPHEREQRPLRFTPGTISITKPKPGRNTDYISSLIDRLNATDESPQRVPVFETKTRVDKQISAIRDMLFACKVPTAEKYLQDLMEFQLGQGDRQHAAMSLCALTTISLDANQLDFAERLSTYALRLDTDDPVVFGNRAEVLKHRAHFAAALNAYKEARVRFPEESHLHNGYADVLSDLGKYDEAIQVYRENQQIFKDDPVAFNGEVSVLRTSGRFSASVDLAIRTAKRFPLDAVSRGMVGIGLMSIGKYSDAIKNLDAAVSLDARNLKIFLAYINALKAGGHIDKALELTSRPRRSGDNASVETARAGLLRAAGRLQESLKTYEQVVSEHPSYTRAYFGAAAVHVLLGNFGAARSVLPNRNMESELDWIGFRSYALSFASAGDFATAASHLRFGMENCPWLHQRNRFQTALGFAELHFGNLSESIRILQRDFERLPHYGRQSRLVLLAHAQASKGETRVADVLLNRMFTSKDPQLQYAKKGVCSVYQLCSAGGISPEELRVSELGLALAA